MTTYERLLADLKASKHRDARGRKIANNTWMRFAKDFEGTDPDGLPSSVIVVQLHSTNIAFLLPDFTAVLNSGGWQTVTTKDRMNEYARTSRIYSEKGQWFVGSEDRPFFDGILVSCAAGAEIGNEQAQMALNAIKNQGDRLIYADWLDEHGQQDAANAHRVLWHNFCGPDWEPPSTDKAKALRKKVDKYARDFVAALAGGRVPAPSGGDCWLCMMNSGERVDSMSSGDDSHLLSHMEEPYYVPRLMLNAMEEGGVSAAARWYVESIWREGQPTSPFGDIGADQIRKAIRKYCLKRLGMPV